MELYVLAGGHNQSLKRWENDLSAQFFPTYTDGKKTVLGKTKDGKPIIEHRRLLVAPIQLYKICFAKEELNNVLPMVCPSSYIEERYKMFRFAVKMFRKLFGLIKCPTPTHINTLMQPNQIDKAVFVVPIGLKKDAMQMNGKEAI